MAVGYGGEDLSQLALNHPALASDSASLPYPRGELSRDVLR
jgi:hypothetical protein